MTRIEAQPESERETLKKEILSEVRHDAVRRKAVGCGSCALVWLVVLGVSAWFVGVTLAKTGFVRVPYVPASTYVPQEPVRPVMPLVGTAPADVPRIVAARATYDARTSSLTIPMGESDLTTVVNDALVSGSLALPFPVERAQVAIEPEFVELFLVSPQEDRQATVRVRFVPEVAAGKVTFRLEEVEVGRVILPKFLGEMIFGLVRPALEDAVAVAASSTGEVREIGLAKTRLTLVLSVSRP